MAESRNLHADLDAIYRRQVRANAKMDLNKMGTTSLEDITHVGQDGHAFVDTNRLVYDYKKHSKNVTVREKVMWYLPDYSFIILNLVSLVACMYFVVVGISALTWYGNMRMFSIPNCVGIVNGTSSSGRSYWGENMRRPEDDFFYIPCKEFTGSARWTKTGFNFSTENNFPIIRTKHIEVHYYGLFLLILQTITVINVIIGIHACLRGYKIILIIHVFIDGFVIFCEMTISGLLTYTAVCERNDLEVVKVLLRHYINNYAVEIRAPVNESEKEKMISLEVDHLQMSLGCCGVSGWEDYLEARYPESDWPHFTAGLDNTEEVIPYSCCQPWWIRNIYCSRGAHLWASPFVGPEKAFQFQERIVSDGCTYKLSRLCQVLKHFMGFYSLIVGVVHLLILLLEIASVVVIIRLINTLIKEKKRLMKKKELTHETGESTSDVDIKNSIVDLARLRASRKSTLGSLKTRFAHVAPPTEDEIYDIKTRSNFNRFITKLRYTPVSTWMDTAIVGVTEGHEKKVAGKTKKAREKELLLKKKDEKRRKLLMKITPPQPPPKAPEPEPKPVPIKPKPRPKPKPEPVSGPGSETKVNKKKLRVPRPGWSQRYAQLHSLEKPKKRRLVAATGWSQGYAQFRSLEKPESKPSVKGMARREKLPEGLSDKRSGKLSEKLAKEIASIDSHYNKPPTKKPTVILFKKDKGKKEKEEEKLEESRTTLQTETEVETTTDAAEEDEMPKEGTRKRKKRRRKKKIQIQSKNLTHNWSNFYSNADTLGRRPYT